MTYTIDLAQLNQYFVVALPIVVAFLAGLLRQDGFSDGLNDAIFHVVLIGLAIAQTLLGGKLGGSSLSNFILALGLSYGTLAGKYKYSPATLMNKVQGATSILKAPPAPVQPQIPQITIDPNQMAVALAARLKEELLASGLLAGQSVDQQPTQALQVVRTNTPQGG